MLTKLAIALLGAFIFVRIVAKEKNRRERHLILRLNAYKQQLLEEEQQRLLAESIAKQAEAAAAGTEENAPTTVTPFSGRTAAA